MPTQTMRRGELRWRGQVWMDGRVAASKWFGAGKAEQRKAITWEEEAKKKLEAQALASMATPTASLSVLDWANAYLADVQLRRAKSTYDEKTRAFVALLKSVPPETPMELVTGAMILKHFQKLRQGHSGCRANKDRKNLAAAWKWGMSYLPGFPDESNPFLKAERFAEERHPRHVPSEEDFWRVMEIAEGQDSLMLLAYFHTGARKSELFRLTWEDVDFQGNRLRLMTRKTADGSWKADWFPMTSELRTSMLQWWENRPFKSVSHVFVVTENQGFGCQYVGQPFTSRQHWLKKLCAKAGVKAFDFHGMRHLTATILFHAGKSLSEIQAVLRHESPQTTVRYLKNLGLEHTRDTLESVMTNRGPGKIVEFKQKEAIGGGR